MLKLILLSSVLALVLQVLAVEHYWTEVLVGPQIDDPESNGYRVGLSLYAKNHKRMRKLDPGQQSSQVPCSILLISRVLRKGEDGCLAKFHCHKDSPSQFDGTSVFCLVRTSGIVIYCGVGGISDYPICKVDDVRAIGRDRSALKPPTVRVNFKTHLTDQPQIQFVVYALFGPRLLQRALALSEPVCEEELIPCAYLRTRSYSTNEFRDDQHPGCSVDLACDGQELSFKCRLGVKNGRLSYCGDGDIIDKLQPCTPQRLRLKEDQRPE